MSEKRFTVMKKFDGSYVICEKGEMLVADDCCELLNEQQATLNRLETELKCYKGIIEALERTRVIEVEIPTDKVRDSKMGIDDE